MLFAASKRDGSGIAIVSVITQSAIQLRHHQGRCLLVLYITPSTNISKKVCGRTGGTSNRFIINPPQKNRKRKKKKKIQKKIINRC
jgi:hypothetical protein